MANLVELFDNIVQMQNLNGVPLANGKMYVYALGRTRLMDTWSDVDGESLNSNPIILDAAGQCHCYVTDDFDYTIVVTDEYNNEIFSIDKYLYSKGSHSHADVAVAPSETIAVSSYHVGETTVYVPYLTGQLGKVYEGIDPIVVNNTEDKISANHVPLGVQDPLYFVQDDEEGCIIGFSGETVPEGVMTESALGFENDKITGYNGSAFSAGNEYEAGSYIDITDNTISVTGLTPVPSDTASTGLVAQVSADIVSQIPSTAGLATTAQLDEKLDKADSANFYPMNSNPSGYLTGLPYDLATTGWVDSQGYLTAVDIPESANWNSTYNTVSANSAQWAGGTANPQIPVTGINGIKISESGDKVVFEVSGDYYTNDNPSGFITGVPADMATTGDIADLAQSISETYQPIGNYQTAGDYYSASNPSGFINSDAISSMATTGFVADVSADITAMIPTALTGDYVTADELSSYKLENSALTVTSVTPGFEIGINTGIAEYGIDGIHVANGYENQYSTGTSNELSLRPGVLSGYSGWSDNYFSVNASGINGSQGTTSFQYHLNPECVSGYNASTAWRYGDKFTNVGFIVKQYGTGLFVGWPDSSGSDNSVAIRYNGLTASGGSGYSAKASITPWDVQVTSYNGDKTYSLTAIGQSQPTTGNMAGYKYIDFPYKVGIFGHTANVQEARKNLTGFNADATFGNASEGIVSGKPWNSYVNIPFTTSADTYDIKWNFTGGYGYNGFTAAILTATADYNWRANSIASAYFSGKSGVLNVTGLTENTTYYLYVYGNAPDYGFTAITPFTAEIGSALWYNYTATSAGFIIPDAPVLTFKVIGE